MTSTTPTSTTTTAARASDPSERPVSVLGLGAMGATLARTFLAAGHPTTVWNRTPQRVGPLAAAGAVPAASAAAAVAASPVVVVCVRDADAVVDLLASLGTGLAGRALVNLTSSTPERAREIAGVATASGAEYLDGAIMVPTPVIGTADAAFLYSGSPTVFAHHRDTLASLGGTAEHLGEDPGLASLYDLGMLDVFFAGMTAFLHALALVGADGVRPATFLPYARTIVGVLEEVLPGLAAEVEAGTYTGDDDTVEMELAATTSIVEASRARGLDVSVPEVTRRLLAEAVERGRGADTFSRIVEQLRAP